MIHPQIDILSADAETGGQNSVKTGAIDTVLNRR